MNSQGRTRKALLENLQSALEEALEMNRASVQGPCEEVTVHFLDASLQSSR